jgi:hypothetical protein
VRVTGLTGMVSEDEDLEVLEHTVRGVRLEAAGRDVFSVALSALDRGTEVWDTQASSPAFVAQYEDHVLGAEADVRLGSISVGGEYARREGGHDAARDSDDSKGSGTYISGALAAPWLTLLAEYKHYDKFDHALVSPPVCVKEHGWTLMNRVTHQVDLDNERGFLAEGILTAAENIQITGGASEARSKGGGLAHWEMFAQLDQPLPRWGIRSLAGSWSRDEYTQGKFKEHKSGGLDLELPLGSDHAGDIGIEMQVVKPHSEATYENYLGSAAFYPWPSVTLAASVESTTEQGLRRDTWAFGEARVSVGGDFEVSLGGGTERGGQKCSGGICYTEPEFAGVRLRFSAFF